jgi:prepilin-type N-terminal cleavage/methylation domain-containing protein
MRKGFSLLELIVAIAVLSLVVSFVAIAPATRRSVHPDAAARAASDAMRTGVTASAQDSLDGLLVNAAAYPDGRVVVESTYIAPDGGRAP